MKYQLSHNHSVDIISRWLNGSSYSEISRVYSVSRQAIHQIVTKIYVARTCIRCGLQFFSSARKLQTCAECMGKPNYFCRVCSECGCDFYTKNYQAATCSECKILLKQLKMSAKQLAVNQQIAYQTSSGSHPVVLKLARNRFIRLLQHRSAQLCA